MTEQNKRSPESRQSDATVTTSLFPSIPIPQEVLERVASKSILTLDLPSSFFPALKEKGIITIERLLKTRFNDLKALRKFGHGTAFKLGEQLQILLEIPAMDKNGEKIDPIIDFFFRTLNIDPRYKKSKNPQTANEWRAFEKKKKQNKDKDISERIETVITPLVIDAMKSGITSPKAILEWARKNNVLISGKPEELDFIIEALRRLSD